MKIPFTLDTWLKDKSQKVETRDGRLVHNIWRIKEPSYKNNRKAEVCALIDGEEDALVFFEGGRYLPSTKDTDSPFDLFIVTPEPELSEDERIRKAIGAAICGTTAENVLEANGVRLTDALTYLEKQKEYIEDIRQYAYNKGLVDAEEKQKPLSVELIADHLDNLGNTAMAEFLRNLRPQPHWKPSEEQMEALKDVIDRARLTCRQQVQLESLYSDLKKL